ncbi:MAG: peptidylprolyl isomerase [Enterobacterales bacterium]
MNNIIKKKFIYYLFIIVILFMTVFTNITYAKKILLDRIVAIVNNSIILQSDIDIALKIYKLNYQLKYKFLPYNMFSQKEILDSLILDTIILQISKNHNITVNNNKVNNALKKILTDNKITFNELNKNLSSLKIKYKDYINKIKTELIINLIENYEMSKIIEIFPQDVNKLAHEIEVKNKNNIKFNLSKLFIPIPNNANNNQIKKLKDLSNYIILKYNEGINFNTLLSIFSKTNTKNNNNQMHWYKLNNLPTIFIPYLESAKKNHISIVGPIKSDIGLYILKINEIKNDSCITDTEYYIHNITKNISKKTTYNQAKNILINISKKIKNGEIDFCTAAKIFSDDLQSKYKGGNIGWKSVDLLSNKVKNILQHIKKNEISYPIYDKYKWKLIKFSNIKKIDITNKYNKKQAYNMLYNNKFISELQFWKEEQFISAYIKIF